MYQTEYERRFSLSAPILFEAFDGKMPAPSTIVRLIPELKAFCEQHGLPWDDLIKSAELAKAPSLVTCTERVAMVNTDKGFGFTTTNTFFHIREGVALACTGADEPEQIACATQLPAKGEMIVMSKQDSVNNNYDRKQAIWWAKFDDYTEAWRQIKERSTYRLVSIATNAVRWQGRDLAKLRTLYPRHVNLEEYGLRVEMVHEGEWVLSTDPRFLHEGGVR